METFNAIVEFVSVYALIGVGFVLFAVGYSPDTDAKPKIILFVVALWPACVPIALGHIVGKIVGKIVGNKE